jgi:ribosomal protein S13
LNYGLINTEYHICVDNDIDDKVIKNISRLIRPLCIRAYMHRNSMPGEKDFGVTKERIKDWSVRLI